MGPGSKVYNQLRATQARIKKKLSTLSSSSVATDIDEQRRLLAEAQQQTIKRLAFSGGGAKGAVYPGSYQAVVDTGILEKVEEVSGASAGAITASLIALGMPSRKFRERFTKVNFEDLLGETIGSKTKAFLPGRSNPKGVAFITKDGSGMLNFLRENFHQSVNEFLKEHSDDIARFNNERLNSLVKKMLSDPAIISFSDLALLNKYWPETFKKLVVPAVRHPDGKLQIFSCDNTPDVEIALACRASASLPIVLEPVEIDLNDGKGPQRFVDGGLYDNLPTDYFDRDGDGHFIKNQKPQQTLVFAFGDRANNQKSHTYQALHGHRWDEAISDNLIEAIFQSAVDLITTKIAGSAETLTSKNLGPIFKPAIQHALQLFVNSASSEEEKKLYRRTANLIMQNSSICLDDLVKNWQKYPEIFQQKKNSEIYFNVKALGEKVQSTIKPILYHADYVEQIKRNKLVSSLGNMQTPYKNTERKEIGYQRLRNEYPLRTIELRVGPVKTTDFNKATKLARVMDSIGYLDSINHITNHELEDSDRFDTDKFYSDLINNFEAIYKAILQGSNKNVAKDSLLNEIEKLRKELMKVTDSRPIPANQATVNQQIYQLIKDQVETNFGSVAAFSLSRAVEFQNNHITAEQLFKETYEEAFRCTSLGRSKFTGETLYSSKSLSKALQKENMFDLYHNQKQERKDARHEKVFTNLNQLLKFQKENNEFLEENNSNILNHSPNF